MIYNNKTKQVESEQIKNNIPLQAMLNESQKKLIRNEINSLDKLYVHLLNSGDYDEMEKLRAKMASLEIKLR